VKTSQDTPAVAPATNSELTEADLQGHGLFKRLQGLFDDLRPCAEHRNRLLHFDEYAMALLFYFFNPVSFEFS